MKRILLCLLLSVLFVGQGLAQRFMDKLDRGLIAVSTNSGMYVSWRILGDEYYGVTYNLYRDGTKVNDTPLSVSNYTDASGSLSSIYTVKAVRNGVEEDASKSGINLSDSYLLIKKAKRVSNDGSTDITNNYQPNDATIADVDGDGQMEILVKEICTSDKVTQADIDFDRIEVYKLDGTLLWWIDCGPNLWDFQHNETNIAAYDWDMDGKAECIMRAADGTKIHAADGKVYTIGDPSKNERSAIGGGSTNGESFIHTGAEYLIYLNGETGKPYEIGTGSTPYYIEYPLKRLETGETNLSKAWGDGYGHRSTKHFFGAPYLDGKHPSIFMARGIYTRHKMIALDVDASTHKLTQRWRWNCNTPGSPWYGQGYHNYTVADVDLDGRDEICFGSMVIDDNGKGLSTTGLGHGDAQHWGDFDPYKHGLEFYGCNETSPSNNYRDATTSKIYYRKAGGGDDGRSMCGNFTDEVPGAIGFSGHDSFISCVAAGHTDAINYTNGVSQNFRIYWDGDLLEESFNGTSLRNSNGAIYKYNKGVIKTFDSTRTNNDTKATPCMQADIFGDWREEVLLRDDDNNIRIETTTTPTKWRNYTLLHDPQYRNAMVWQMNGYNQPPHVSYFLGELEGITMAPPAPTTTGREEIAAGGTISAAYNGKQVLADETADATYAVAAGAQPEIFFDNAPSWVQGHDNNDNITYTYYTHTLTGGAFAGNMRLVKQGDGTLVLPKVTETYSGSTDVWAGQLNFDGTMQNSRVWLNRFAALNSDGGSFPKGIQADYGASVRPGGEKNIGTLTTDSLILNFGSILDIDVKDDGTSDQVKANVITLEKKDWTVGPQFLAPRVHINNLSDNLKAGDYVIATANTVKGDVSSVALTGLNGHKASLAYADGKLILTIADTRTAASVVWAGGQSADWDVATTSNFTNSATSDDDIFVTGDSVTFNDNAKSTSVNIAQTVYPSAVTFDNYKKDFTLTGDSLCGKMNLTKRGEGTVSINNVNRFTGKVSIEGGTLNVNSLANKEGVDYGALGGADNEISISDGATLGVTASAKTTNKIRFVGKSTLNVASGATLTMATSIRQGAAQSSLTKTGAGTLTFGGNNYLDTLKVAQGTVNLYDGSQPGSIIFSNGTKVYDSNTFGSYSTNAAKLSVPSASATASLYLDPRCNYTGTLTGAGTLQVYAAGIRNTLSGNWSGFTGTLIVDASKRGSYDPSFDWTNDYGLPKATLSINSGRTFNAGSHTVKIGHVAGSGTLSGTGNVEFGSLNQLENSNVVFSGVKLRKVGSGNWNVNASKPQTGLASLTIAGGKMALSGSSDMTQLLTGTIPVNVTDSGVVAGEGYLRSINVNGGTLEPGNIYLHTGYIKVDKNVTVNTGWVVFYISSNKNIKSSRSYLQVGGTLTINDSIIVNQRSGYSPAVGDSINLWTAESFAGTPRVKLFDLPKGMQWDTTGLTQPTGYVKVVAATGISTVNATVEGPAEVYTLDGQLVGGIEANMTNVRGKVLKLTNRKGVYIVKFNQAQAVKVIIR